MNNKHDYTFKSTECDWCEEIKDCRGLEDFQGNVVLVICRDCESHVEEAPAESTNNQKEGPKMGNKPVSTPNCCAIVKGDMCSNKGKLVVNCYISGMTAYLYNALPSRYVGGGWLLESVPVCGTHKNALARGAALSVRFKVVQPEAVSQQQTLDLKPEIVTETVSAEGRIGCGKCKGKHNTPAEVRACFGVAPKPVRNGDYFLQNTQVRRIADPYQKKTGNYFLRNDNPVKKIRNPYS